MTTAMTASSWRQWRASVGAVGGPNGVVNVVGRVNGVGSVVGAVDNVVGSIARVPFSRAATRRAEPAGGVAGGDGDRAAAGHAGAGCHGRSWGWECAAQCVAALLVGS